MKELKISNGIGTIRVPQINKYLFKADGYGRIITSIHLECYWSAHAIYREGLKIFVIDGCKLLDPAPFEFIVSKAYIKHGWGKDE